MQVSLPRDEIVMFSPGGQAPTSRGRAVLDDSKGDDLLAVGERKLPPVASISKAPVSVLGIAQLMLASVQLIENSVLISLDGRFFRYAEARNAIRFIWAVTVIWMITIAFLLYGVMSNRQLFILPHFIFIAFLVALKVLVLTVLIATSSFPFSIVICAITIIVLLLSLYFEWKCFAQIRAAQKLFLLP